jgi:hypothetical protein
MVFFKIFSFEEFMSLAKTFNLKENERPMVSMTAMKKGSY